MQGSRAHGHGFFLRLLLRTATDQLRICIATPFHLPNRMSLLQLWHRSRSQTFYSEEALSTQSELLRCHVMPFGLRLIATAILLCVFAGCGNSSIVGKWRLMGGESDAILWEFSPNGAVLIGDVRGKYKFGDQNRIKIETPFATTVYQLKIAGNQMTLQEPGGSKLEFTRINEAAR